MHEDELINKIASEIEQYLTTHPQAADDINGITQWWLLRQRLIEHTDNVKKALKLLISKGYVIEKINLDGSSLYLKSSENREK